MKTLLEKRFSRLLSPLERFVDKQTNASVLLIIATLSAFLLANTQWSNVLSHLSSLELGVNAGDNEFSLSLQEWINQGLMSAFFFLTGLELKREILAGELRHTKELILISMAALGGIVVPAIFYYMLNQNGIGQNGWAIPTATDTAFAIGILALLATRVSIGMALFLTALAIFDDIGAIFIISLFYAHDINSEALTIAALLFVSLLSSNQLGVRSGWVYTLLGVLLWWFVFKSDIHPTLSGLLLALTIPARPVLSKLGFLNRLRHLAASLEKSQEKNSLLGSPNQHSIVADIGKSARAASTPLQRWEDSFITPIAIIVLPLFAFFNAGFILNTVTFWNNLSSPITLGIIMGLVVGKPLGIILFTYATLMLRWGKLPKGVGLSEVVGIGLLAGIGFTMSMFFTTISFAGNESLYELAKLGILLSSLVSALLGSVWIFCMMAKAKSD